MDIIRPLQRKGQQTFFVGHTYKARIAWNIRNKKAHGRALIREHVERQAGAARSAGGRFELCFYGENGPQTGLYLTHIP